jgi:hypothetical protein
MVAWTQQELATPDSVEGVLGIIVGNQFLDTLVSAFFFIGGVSFVSYGLTFLINYLFSKAESSSDKETEILEWNKVGKDDELTNGEKITSAMTSEGFLDENSTVYIQQISRIVQEKYITYIREQLQHDRASNQEWELNDRGRGQGKTKGQVTIVIDKIHEYFMSEYGWPESSRKYFQPFVNQHFSAMFDYSKHSFLRDRTRIFRRDSVNRITS